MFTNSILSPTLRSLLFACLLALTGFAACFNPFAPALDESVDLSNVITEQRTPEEVLQNFRLAYTFQDSLLYSDVLDPAFIFEFVDANLKPDNWGRDTDLKTTGRLFRSFDSVDLHWDPLFSDSTETRQQRFVRFNLNLFGSDVNFIVTGIAVFTFKQSTQDGRWRIERWRDESSR